MKYKFRYFSYFYEYLGYRVFIAFFLSFLVGLLDGIGLALFIPLLKLVANNSTQTIAGHDEIGSFIVEVLSVSPTLINILGLIFLFFALKGMMKYLEGYVRVLYQQYFMRTIRLSNIDLLDSYGYQDFVKSDVGRIQNTFTGEVGRVNSAFRFYFKAFQYGVLVLVYLVMAFAADPIFSLIVAAGGVFTNFIFKELYKRTKNLSQKLTVENHIFQGFLIQKVAFFKYLKTTGLDLAFSKKLKANVLQLENIQRRIGTIDSLLGALREPMIILIVIIAIYVQVVTFNEDLGLIILSLLLLYRALTFFMGMQEQWNFFLGVSGSLENMEDFSRELRSGKESTGTEFFSGFREKISLKGVHFSYDEKEILKDINLEIYKNETIAFVGESGSGKSTLMNIISGLLEPQKGACLVDGIPVRNLEPKSFKKSVGYIAQESNTFNDSIYNNVTFWAEKNEKNILKFFSAVKEAAILDFIMQLTEKEETLLGNNGITLSGGQKQRLAIARELFKQVDLLLMDEATSALDGETEAIVQQNIEKLRGKLTIVVIAHRLATVKNADRIVVLKEGKIKAVGPYSELLKSSSDFAEMIRLQNL